VYDNKFGTLLISIYFVKSLTCLFVDLVFSDQRSLQETFKLLLDEHILALPPKQKNSLLQVYHPLLYLDTVVKT